MKLRGAGSELAFYRNRVLSLERLHAVRAPEGYEGLQSTTARLAQQQGLLQPPEDAAADSCITDDIVAGCEPLNCVPSRQRKSAASGSIEQPSVFKAVSGCDTGGSFVASSAHNNWDGLLAHRMPAGMKLSNLPTHQKHDRSWTDNNANYSSRPSENVHAPCHEFQHSLEHLPMEMQLVDGFESIAETFADTSHMPASNHLPIPLGPDEEQIYSPNLLDQQYQLHCVFPQRGTSRGTSGVSGGSIGRHMKRSPSRTSSMMSLVSRLNTNSSRGVLYDQFEAISGNQQAAALSVVSAPTPFTAHDIERSQLQPQLLHPCQPGDHEQPLPLPAAAWHLPPQQPLPPPPLQLMQPPRQISRGEVTAYGAFSGHHAITAGAVPRESTAWRTSPPGAGDKEPTDWSSPEHGAVTGWGRAAGPSHSASYPTAMHTQERTLDRNWLLAEKGPNISAQDAYDGRDPACSGALQGKYLPGFNPLALEQTSVDMSLVPYLPRHQEDRSWLSQESLGRWLDDLPDSHGMLQMDNRHTSRNTVD